MNNAIYNFKAVQNEPVREYRKGSEDRALLDAELERLSNMEVEIPLIIGGKEIKTGNTKDVVMPHDHGHRLGIFHQAGEAEVEMAVEAAMNAHKIWSNLPWTVRASIMLKVAELLAGKYRYTILAATMLGQSKNIYQGEIDAVCEAIDFLRFNTSFASKIYNVQPNSGFNQLNRMEYRPLEGFVFAVSPFNFTAIASNLNMAPVMMGNVTIWKPATSSLYSNYFLMKVFKEAGVPDGVINFVPGKGSTIGNVVLNHKDLGGIHFTGSNGTFNNLWRIATTNLEKYKSYPRIVGETGGKDFIFVHPSADIQEVAVNTIRGAFEFQGQKCSAASRMYVPASIWDTLEKELKDLCADIQMGDVRDAKNFVNAVIDKGAFQTITEYIDYARDSEEAEFVAGGNYDDSKGYFIEPTIIRTTNPKFKTMEEEIFGPVITIFVYEDDKMEEALELCDTTSPYGLTGAVFSRDRVEAARICSRLQYAAGNFYINDKPTGAIVGLQPFGGSRQSGTNDKAGGEHNLMRWITPRTIKETFMPATDYKYPYMYD
jgi:1-pyrroline-5-carboxylate dehydrogenase